MIWFTASSSAVEVLRELNTQVVVLAENKDGSGRRLEFQKALNFDVSDVEAGMDTYCLVVESGATHYGGVIGWAIEEHQLALHLDDGAAEELGLVQQLQVDLQLGSEGEAALQTGLEQVLQAS